MKSKISNQGNHQKIIEVDLTEEELAPHFETVYRKYQKKIRLQGFRKGKVPLGLIKKLYGEEIKNEAIDEVVQKVFKEVSQNENLHPVAPANLQDVDYKRDEGLHFKAIVEVMPEIELNNYKGLTVEREIYEVGEEDVAASLEDVREQMAVMQPVEEGAIENNYILADLQEIDATGVPLVGKKFENQFFQLSKNGTNKEITEQLIGVKPGETRRVEMLPIIDGEGNENKKEIYNVNVKEIKVKQLPDLDDELGKDVGKFETLEELKADIKKKLIKQAQVNAKRKFRQRMIDEILKRNAFDLPEVMIDNYLDALVENATKESKQKIDAEVLKKE
ncbi:MAG: trigger factor, partial [bacterium]